MNDDERDFPTSWAGVPGAPRLEDEAKDEAIATERARALAVLGRADVALREMRDRDPERARTWLSGGDAFVEALEEALAAGCERAGLDADSFARAIAAHPDLQALEEAIARSALGDERDPGPYDALSARDPPGSQDRDPGTGAHEPAPRSTKAA